MNYSARIQLAALILAGVILSGCQVAETSSVITAPVPETVAAAPAKEPANETIRFLEERIKRDPEDHIAHNKLASEYLQRLRETGDITYLDLAGRSAKASLSVLPAEQNKGGL